MPPFSRSPDLVSNSDSPDKELQRDKSLPVNERDYLLEAEVDTSYIEKFELNGIEVSVGWDDGYRCYTVYLPQSTSFEQIVRTGEDIETAKIVFAAACKLVKEGDNPNSIIKKIDTIASAMYK